MDFMLLLFMGIVSLAGTPMISVNIGGKKIKSGTVSVASTPNLP